MTKLLMITQTFIILTTSLFCLPQECYSKELIYNGGYSFSCKDILAKYPATPSGVYPIQPPGASVSDVYCDMENERCGSKGWTRIANVNVSNDKKCHGDLIYNTSGSIHTCRGPATIGCASANFSSYGISYSQVCGKLRGYQVGTPNAFGPYMNNPANPNLIMDGVLISHGETQGHIWAYAVGIQKIPSTSFQKSRVCPCTGPSFRGIVPPFIGNDYYCDSAVERNAVSGKFYTKPLWTGKECTPPNFCCSRSGMPWFCKTLPVSTTDHIEIRNCHNDNTVNDYENIALDEIELYIR